VTLRRIEDSTHSVLDQVKTVIRNKNTGKYLEANGSWTTDLAQAFGFADTRSVISAVQIHKLVGVEMVVFMRNGPASTMPL